jgi:hypothetical protein
MIKNADRSLIPALKQNFEHFLFMFSFSESQNLGLCPSVHAIEVEAVEEGFHEIEVILPFLDPVVSVVPIVDDPDVIVPIGSKGLANGHQVFRFPAPTAMVVKT